MIIFALKEKWFVEIVKGWKTEEYRLRTEYWKKRLEKLKFGDVIEFTKGYPARGDKSKRIRKVFTGLKLITMIHEEFGKDPVEVYSISFCDKKEILTIGNTKKTV